MDLSDHTQLCLGKVLSGKDPNSPLLLAGTSLGVDEPHFSWVSFCSYRLGTPFFKASDPITCLNYDFHMLAQH